MSGTYIPAALRQLVRIRAFDCCEYCRMGENAGVVSFSIDHIISEKHGGKTIPENLAYACYWCNSYKGSDIGSIDWENQGEFLPLFNPRRDNWQEHFYISAASLYARTQIADITIHLLRLNSVDRLKERRDLIQLDQYPCHQG